MVKRSMDEEIPLKWVNLSGDLMKVGVGVAVNACPKLVVDQVQSDAVVGDIIRLGFRDPVCFQTRNYIATSLTERV